MSAKHMNNPIGVYIHIPFCRHKCFYCDFHSTAGAEDLIDEYVDAAVAEIMSQAKMVNGRDAASVFFGGGTPSLLTARSVGRMVDACAKHLKLRSGAEITIEANPESVTLPKVRGYRAVGVNRVSIGVQSLNDGSLKWLERIHTAARARKAVAAAFDAGFDNVSADLMFGLPGQWMDGWIEDLTEAAGWGLSHLSCYQLTPEKGTPLGRAVAKGTVRLPDTPAFFDATAKPLRSMGYRHYEISNYARPGHECVHNLGYWQWRDYLGIGAGASGKLGGARWTNVKSIGAYIARARKTGRAVWRRETITPEMEQTERLMLGLRLKGGVPLRRITITPAIEKMIAAGMLERTKTRLRATSNGWRLLDSVLAAL